MRFFWFNVYVYIRFEVNFFLCFFCFVCFAFLYFECILFVLYEEYFVFVWMDVMIDNGVWG